MPIQLTVYFDFATFALNSRDPVFAVFLVGVSDLLESFEGVEGGGASDGLERRWFFGEVIVGLVG